MVPAARLSSRLAVLFLTLVAFAFLMPSPVRADTAAVNFADTSDTVLATKTGSRASIDVTSVVCNTLSAQGISVECASATIMAPGTLLKHANLTSGNQIYLVTENGVVSDVMIVFGFANAAHVVFLSDAAVSGTDLPGVQLSCDHLAEALEFGDFTCHTSTSETQTATITWSTGGPDTASFQSDTEGGGVTPEPASLVLLGTGLLALAGFIKRRL